MSSYLTYSKVPRQNANTYTHWIVQVIIFSLPSFAYLQSSVLHWIKLQDKGKNFLGYKKRKPSRVNATRKMSASTLDDMIRFTSSFIRHKHQFQ